MYMIYQYFCRSSNLTILFFRIHAPVVAICALLQICFAVLWTIHIAANVSKVIRYSWILQSNLDGYALVRYPLFTPFFVERKKNIFFVTFAFPIFLFKSKAWCKNWNCDIGNVKLSSYFFQIFDLILKIYVRYERMWKKGSYLRS